MKQDLFCTQAQRTTAVDAETDSTGRTSKPSIIHESTFTAPSRKKARTMSEQEKLQEMFLLQPPPPFLPLHARIFRDSADTTRERQYTFVADGFQICRAVAGLADRGTSSTHFVPSFTPSYPFIWFVPWSVEKAENISKGKFGNNLFGKHFKGQVWQ